MAIQQEPIDWRYLTFLLGQHFLGLNFRDYSKKIWPGIWYSRTSILGSWNSYWYTEPISIAGPSILYFFLYAHRGCSQPRRCSVNSRHNIGITAQNLVQCSRRTPSVSASDRWCKRAVAELYSHHSELNRSHSKWFLPRLRREPVGILSNVLYGIAHSHLCQLLWPWDCRMWYATSAGSELCQENWPPGASLVSGSKRQTGLGQTRPSVRWACAAKGGGSAASRSRVRPQLQAPADAQASPGAPPQCRSSKGHFLPGLRPSHAAPARQAPKVHLPIELDVVLDDVSLNPQPQLWLWRNVPLEDMWKPKPSCLRVSQVPIFTVNDNI